MLIRVIQYKNCFLYFFYSDKIEQFLYNKPDVDVVKGIIICCEIFRHSCETKNWINSLLL